MQENDLREEMDYWVKDMEKKISRSSDVSKQVQDNVSNIDFNYELIQGLQKEIQEMKQQLKEVKSYLYISLKSRPLKELDEK